MPTYKDLCIGIDTLIKKSPMQSFTSDELQHQCDSPKSNSATFLRGAVRLGKLQATPVGKRLCYQYALGVTSMEREYEAHHLDGFSAAARNTGKFYAPKKDPEDDNLCELDPEEFLEQLPADVLAESIVRLIKRDQASLVHQREVIVMKDNEIARLHERLTARDVETEQLRQRQASAEAEVARLNAMRIVPQPATRVVMVKSNGVAQREHGGSGHIPRGVAVHTRPYPSKSVPTVVIHRHSKKQ